MDRYRHTQRACSFLLFLFAVLLFSINAGAINHPSAWVRLTLVYYKNFPYHGVKGRAPPVSGCTLRTDSAGLHHTLWHCQERIYLLRPLSEPASWNRDQGPFKPKFSVFKINHIQAKITSFHILKKIPDLSDKDHMPVTAIFITHSLKVRQYQFINTNTGTISSIRATYDHPFYLEDRKIFVPVSQISPVNNLINNKHELIKIICPENIITHCGTVKGYLPFPTQVYNLEVYKKHAFYAGGENLFVHNCTLSYNHHATNVGFEYVMVKGEKVHRESIRKVTVDNIRKILSSMKDVDDIDIHRMAIYSLHGNEKPMFNENALYFQHQLKSPEEIAVVLRQAPEFEKAKTVLITNCAPVKKSKMSASLFSRYFQSLANHIHKDVIYNSQGKMYVIPCEYRGHIVMYLNWQDKIESNCFTVLFNNFMFNKFVRVRPQP